MDLLNRLHKALTSPGHIESTGLMKAKTTLLQAATVETSLLVGAVASFTAAGLDAEFVNKAEAREKAGKVETVDVERRDTVIVLDKHMPGIAYEMTAPTFNTFNLVCAGAGAYGGNQFGKGTGKVLMTITGGVAGLAACDMADEMKDQRLYRPNLDPSDMDYMAKAEGGTKNLRTGQIVGGAMNTSVGLVQSWENPRSENEGYSVMKLRAHMPDGTQVVVMENALRSPTPGFFSTYKDAEKDHTRTYAYYKGIEAVNPATGQAQFVPADRLSHYEMRNLNQILAQAVVIEEMTDSHMALRSEYADGSVNVAWTSQVVIRDQTSGAMEISKKTSYMHYDQGGNPTLVGGNFGGIERSIAEEWQSGAKNVQVAGDASVERMQAYEQIVARIVQSRENAAKDTLDTNHGTIKWDLPRDENVSAMRGPGYR